MDADDHEAVTVFLVILQSGDADLFIGFVEGLPEPVSANRPEELPKSCNRTRQPHSVAAHYQ